MLPKGISFNIIWEYKTFYEVSFINKQEQIPAGFLLKRSKKNQVTVTDSNCTLYCYFKLFTNR